MSTPMVDVNVELVVNNTCRNGEHYITSLTRMNQSTGDYMKYKVTKKGRGGQCVEEIGEITPAAIVPMKAGETATTAKILIGVPSLGIVTMSWVSNFVLMSSPPDVAWSWYFPIGKSVADARNICIDVALARGCDYVLFLDDDVLAPPNTLNKLYTLARTGKKVVSGLYYSKSSISEPLIFRGDGTGPFLDWEVGDLVQVTSCPMGCALINTEIFRIMEKPWFQTPSEAYFLPETKEWIRMRGTEDIYWCNKAVRLGFDIWVDTSIVCGHIDKHSMYVFPSVHEQLVQIAEMRLAAEGSQRTTLYMDKELTEEFRERSEKPLEEGLLEKAKREGIQRGELMATFPPIRGEKRQVPHEGEVDISIAQVKA